MSNGDPRPPVRHHFTVDVEEYFHPTALERWAPPDTWSGLERRSPRVVDKLLEFLEDRDLKGTFFVVGWLADREPAMVKRISAAGHEVGSHSWDHRLVSRQTPQQFRESARRSKGILEDLTGSSVIGFRAPSWSIVPGLEWALEVLVEEGFEYDSSLFPVAHHPTYGYPGISRDPFWHGSEVGRFAEFPPATLNVLGRNLGASGGAYFRFLPLRLVRMALEGAARRGQPGTFYIHPWELDDFVPDFPMTWAARIRTFYGLGRTWRRIERLAEEFRFQRMDRTLEGLRSPSVQP